MKTALGEPITGHGEESGRGRRKQLKYIDCKLFFDDYFIWPKKFPVT